jgi:hypothetical protein
MLAILHSLGFVDFLAEIFDQEASLAAFNRFESQQRVRRVDSAMSELSPFTPQ